MGNPSYMQRYLLRNSKDDVWCVAGLSAYILGAGYAIFIRAEGMGGGRNMKQTTGENGIDVEELH